MNQPNSHNQQDSLESASPTRTRKIPLNRQDYLESARLPNSTDSRHGFSSIEPPPSTAHHSSRVSVVQLKSSSRDTSDSFGFVGCILWAPEPLPSDSRLDVLCPFMGLLVYGHRPFHLCPRAVVAVLCLRALSYAYGPFWLLYLRALARFSLIDDLLY